MQLWTTKIPRPVGSEGTRTAAILVEGADFGSDLPGLSQNPLLEGERDEASFQSRESIHQVGYALSVGAIQLIVDG